MTGRNILQEIIDGYIASKANQKDKITYSRIPHLTIVTSFWFMRITGKHYASLRKSEAPEVSFKQTEKAVQDIQKEICQHFSDVFSGDFDCYTLYVIDDLYKNLEKVTSEYKNMPDNDCLDEGISKEIRSLIDETLQLRECIIAFENNYREQFSSLFNNVFYPSSVIDIHSYAQQKRNDPLFYTQNENFNGDILWNRFKKHAGSLMASIEDLQKIVTNLFCTDNLRMEKAISFFNKMNLPNITAFLHSIQYPASIHFNLEAMFIFMFVDYSILDRKFSCLVNKYESFFYHLYASLRKGHPMIDTILFPLDSTDHEESLEGYIGPPANDRFIEKKLSFFHLKKLIALQRFYMSTSGNSLTPAEDNLLTQFDRLLSCTKLPYVAYHFTLDDLPTYTMELLGINQTDLSTILSINKSTISRQINAETFIKRNKWFWVAVGGYTYEYLNGETTIPNYGKPTYKDDNIYLIAPAVTLAHGELFLKRISSLKEYRARIRKNNSNRKTNRLSQKHLQKISQEAIFLTEHLKKCRDYIDKLCERERNEHMNASVNNGNTDIVKFSESATKKLLFYLGIFDRMLDALQENHIVEIQTSFHDKDVIHFLNLMENIMNSLSILTLEFVKSINKNPDEILLTDEFKKCSKLTQKQLTSLNEILTNIEQEIK